MNSIFRILLFTFIILFGNVTVFSLSASGTDKEAKSKEKTKVQYSYGIDISRYQQVNWEKLDSTNLHFIICKASEGIQLIDPKFESNWKKIKPSIKKGAYHFFRPGVSGKEQAKLFLSVAKFEKGHIVPVIDVEYCRAYHKLSPALFQRNLKEMIRYVEKEVGVKPIIYTNASFWNRYYGTHFKGVEKEYHLWIADYRLRDEPSIPSGWQDWSIWQHSCKGIVSGISSEVDLNICKVNLDDLLIK